MSSAPVTRSAAEEARRPAFTTDILGASHAMQEAVDLAHQFAATDCHILLVGETGTGKELFANAIHTWSGRPGPLLDINCGAIPPALIEAELFGHNRGAFTGAVTMREGLVMASHTGTLFLDEIGSLAFGSQAVLLRVLETREVQRLGEIRKRPVDLRVISAAQPGFELRPDLLYRLAGAVIQLPPLRERGRDVLLLARAFAARRGKVLLPEAADVLDRHVWPGNVRELATVMDRAAHLAPSQGIDTPTIMRALMVGWSARPAVEVVDGQDRAALEELCTRCNWRVETISAVTGWSRATVYRRLKAAGVRLAGLRSRTVALPDQ